MEGDLGAALRTYINFCFALFHPRPWTVLPPVVPLGLIALAVKWKNSFTIRCNYKLNSAYPLLIGTHNKSFTNLYQTQKVLQRMRFTVEETRCRDPQVVAFVNMLILKLYCIIQFRYT